MFEKKSCKKSFILMNITWEESFAVDIFSYYDWVPCDLNKLYGGTEF